MEIQYKKDSANDLLINKHNKYSLKIYQLINQINLSLNYKSQISENVYVLNLLLISSKLNKSNKLICYLFLFSIYQKMNKKPHLANFYFNKIKKLISKGDNNENILNTILLNEAEYLETEQNIFNSKEFIEKINSIIHQNSFSDLIKSSIEKISQSINVGINSYLSTCKSTFFDLKNDKTLEKIKLLIDQLCLQKNTIDKNSKVYLINKGWVFKTKLFIEPFISMKKARSPTLKDSFNIEKVFPGMFKKYLGIIFSGPITNYNILDFRDYWNEDKNAEKMNYAKDDSGKEKDYFYISEKDWIFLKNIFGKTDEIVKREEKFENIKIVVIDQRLSNKENRHLLKKRYIEITPNSTIKKFKEKIIKCLDYEISLSQAIKNKNEDKNNAKEQKIVFYLLNKKNKIILMEIFIALVNKIKVYQTTFLYQVELDDDNAPITELINYYNKKEYLLIAEVIPKNGYNFLQQILPINRKKKNIYNCCICQERLNINEKYNCDSCNMALFCSSQCADASGEHATLHRACNKFYKKKFSLDYLCNEKMKFNSDESKGAIGLEKGDNYSCLNSVIQCLSNTMDLTKYFTNNLHLHDFNIYNALSKAETLVSRYSSLIKELWMGNQVNSNLEKVHMEFILTFFKTLNINNNSIKDDPHEVIQLILNNFHRELNRTINVDVPETDETENENREKNEFEDKQTLDDITEVESKIIKERSIITDLFEGIYRSSLSCSLCGNVSITYDSFKLLILPIPKKTDCLNIKYFDGFECKNFRFIMDDYSTIRALKIKAMKNMSRKITHLLQIMSLTELIEVAAFDSEDEKLLSHVALFNSIELVVFDKNKVISKFYRTKKAQLKNDNYIDNIERISENKNEGENVIKNENTNENKTEEAKENENKTENKNEETENDLDLKLNEVLKDDIELVFYEKSVLDEASINLYFYPLISTDETKMNKNKEKIFNVYPIAISVNPNLYLDNFEYYVNIKLKDLLMNQYLKKEEAGESINYLNILLPHYFNNSSAYNYNQICPLCGEKRKSSLYCNIFKNKQNLNKEKNTLQDLLNILEYPQKPIFFWVSCEYFDFKKSIYSNMNAFPIEKYFSQKSSNDKIDIYDCFELYTKNEEILNSKCNSCGKNQNAEKQLLLYKPPLYFIIQLNRFTLKQVGNKYNYVLDDTLINFPINNLNIGEYVEGPYKNKAVYNLYGAIYREINNKKDLIYSVCKNNKKWLSYKDNVVSSTNFIINKYATYLFYKRQDLPE